MGRRPWDSIPSGEPTRVKISDIAIVRLYQNRDHVASTGSPVLGAAEHELYGFEARQLAEFGYEVH